MGYRTITMPALDELTELLKQSSLFGGLDNPSITRLHNLLECGQAEAGECIRPRGDNNPALYLIQSGRIQLRMTGNPVPIADLRRGQSFGLLSILFPGEAFTEACAVETSTFIVLDSSTMRMLEISNPQLALLVLRSIRIELAPLINQALPVIARTCLK